MRIIIKKFNNLIVYFFSLLFCSLIRLKGRKIIPGTLLIVRLDAIGDYVLFRNFLREIRHSQRFSNSRITLCGNQLWKELALSLDAPYADEFIWVDKNEFYTDMRYRLRLLQKIYQSGYEVALCPTYSREILFDDMIIKASGSPERAGSEGAHEKHAKWKRTLFTDRIYTTLVSAVSRNIFEFQRNREFFENYLQLRNLKTELAIDKNCLKPRHFKSDGFVLLFPGAGEIKRQWKTDNFIKTARFLLENYSYDIALAGSPKEYPIAQEITAALASSRVYNLAGSTELSGLARLISDAELLISNETSSVHFAASVKTPVICISNGGFLGRFHPYPEEIFAGAYYIYPSEIRNNSHLFSGETNPYRYGSDLNVDEILPEQVISRIKEILK